MSDSLWRPDDTDLLGWVPVEIDDPVTTDGWKLGSAIRFRNGMRAATGVIEAELMAVLPMEGRPPLLVIGGRECEDCDAGFAVYVESLEQPDSTRRWNAGVFEYPGRVFSHDDDGGVIFESRLFTGQCLPGRGQIAVWFGIDHSDSTPRDVVHLVEMHQTRPVSSNMGPPLPSIDMTLDLVARGRCREVPGRGHTAGW